MEQILINLVAGTLGRIGCSDQPHAKSSDKVVGYSGVDLRGCPKHCPAGHVERPDATRRKAKAREERRRLIHIKRRSRGQT
jgi:hypothetical protein